MDRERTSKGASLSNCVCVLCVRMIHHRALGQLLTNMFDILNREKVRRIKKKGCFFFFLKKKKHCSIQAILPQNATALLTLKSNINNGQMIELDGLQGFKKKKPL